MHGSGLHLHLHLVPRYPVNAKLQPVDFMRFAGMPSACLQQFWLIDQLKPVGKLCMQDSQRMRAPYVQPLLIK